jgi:putative hydrolase of the HAD superfamily
LRAIFFDLDETLLTTSYGEAIEATCRLAAERLRLSDWEPLYHTYHRVCEALWANFDAWGPGLGRQGVRTYVWRAALEEAAHVPGAALVEELMDYYARQRRVQHEWLPGARETVATLCGRYHLGIITNGAAEIQREKIRALGLETWCPVLLVSEECGASKPDARIFEHALREAGVTAAESLMVGDRAETDIVGAHGVGMRAVWIAPSARGEWSLAAPRPCLRLAAVAELPAPLVQIAEAAGSSS